MSNYFSRCVIAMFLLSGCILHTRRSDAKCSTNSGIDCLSNNLSVATLTTKEQQKIFGPFPEWNIQEGMYNYKLFTMRYLVDNDTGLRNIKRSWIAALYSDAELSGKYMFKFSTRIKCPQNGVWKEENQGSVIFCIKDGRVQFIEQIDPMHSQSKIGISVAIDEEMRSYLQIKISDKWCHDELRSFVNLNMVE